MTQALPEERSPVLASVVLQQLHDTAPKDRFTLGWLIGRMQSQSFGMLLLLLAIAAAVPGICVFAALLIVTSTLQIAFGRQAPYFPHWIADRPLPVRHLGAAVPYAIRLLRFFEKAIRPRGAAPSAAMKRLAAIVMLLLTMPILLVPVPLSNVLPAFLVALIALAQLEEDRLWLTLAILAGAVFLAINLAFVREIVRGSGAA